MTTPNAKMVDRLRKLMAAAEGELEAGNEEAAKAFAEKAEELAEAYAIELNSIGDAERVAMIGVHYLRIRGNLQTARRHLGFQVARLVNGDAVVNPMGAHDGQLTFLGTKEQFEAFCVTFEFIEVQMRAAIEDHKRRGSIRGASQQSSFATGFATRIGFRVEQILARRRTEHQAAGTALVLVSDIEKLKAEKFPHLRKMKMSISDAKAYNQGQAAGSHADIGQDRVGGAGIRKAGALH